MSDVDKAELNILALLYSPGVVKEYGIPIRGRTRLMKELFLLDKESNTQDFLIRDIGEFIPYKFGPFSLEVQVALSNLINSGHVLVNEKQAVGDEYSLSEKGTKKAREFWNEFGDKVKKDVFFIKFKYNKMPINKLLHYVYSRYPEYTIKSEIAEKIL